MLPHGKREPDHHIKYYPHIMTKRDLPVLSISDTMMSTPTNEKIFLYFYTSASHQAPPSSRTPCGCKLVRHFAAYLIPTAFPHTLSTNVSSSA